MQQNTAAHAKKKKKIRQEKAELSDSAAMQVTCTASARGCLCLSSLPLQLFCLLFFLIIPIFPFFLQVSRGLSGQALDTPGAGTNCTHSNKVTDIALPYLLEVIWTRNKRHIGVMLPFQPHFQYNTRTTARSGYTYIVLLDIVPSVF